MPQVLRCAADQAMLPLRTRGMTPAAARSPLGRSNAIEGDPLEIGHPRSDVVLHHRVPAGLGLMPRAHLTAVPGAVAEDLDVWAVESVKHEDSLTHAASMRQRAVP